MTEEKKKTILIVEDEPAMRRALADKLEMEGFDYLEAKNGEEGLEMAIKHHPDLILLDLIMPKMDGVTMFNKLRDDEWGRNASIVILTNLDDENRIVEATNSDEHDYLIKSNWKMEELVQKLRLKLGM